MAAAEGAEVPRKEPRTTSSPNLRPQAEEEGAAAEVALRQPQAGPFYTSDTPDYVAGHIAQQEAFRAQQDQQRQAAQQQLLNQLNGPGQNGQQQPAQPPPITWSPDDQTQLNTAAQAVADTNKAITNGDLGEETGKMVMAPYQDKFNALSQKQQAYSEQQQRQQLKQQQTAAAAQDSLTAVRTGHLNGAMNSALLAPDDIPGMPTRVWGYDDKGVPVVRNEKERLAHQAGYYKLQEIQATAQAKDQTEAKAQTSISNLVKEHTKAMDAEILQFEEGKRSTKPAWADDQEARDRELDRRVNSHRSAVDRLSGKAAPARSPQAQSSQVPQEKFDALMGSLFNTKPAPTVPKVQSPRSADRAYQDSAGLGDHFGSPMFGSW